MRDYTGLVIMGKDGVFLDIFVTHCNKAKKMIVENKRFQVFFDLRI